MCSDLQQELLKNFDKITMVANVPQIFKGLSGNDSNIELVSSNTLLNLKLFHRYNIVDKMIAVIFVHTEILGRKGEPTMQYRDAMLRAEETKKMFVEVLNIEDVVICKNFSKPQMIEKFTELTEKAKTYTSVDGSHQAVFCINIGFRLDYIYKEHLDIMNKRGIEKN